MGAEPRAVCRVGTKSTALSLQKRVVFILFPKREFMTTGCRKRSAGRTPAFCPNRPQVSGARVAAGGTELTPFQGAPCVSSPLAARRHPRLPDSGTPSSPPSPLRCLLPRSRTPISAKPGEVDSRARSARRPLGMLRRQAGSRRRRPASEPRGSSSGSASSSRAGAGAWWRRRGAPAAAAAAAPAAAAATRPAPARRSGCGASSRRATATGTDTLAGTRGGARPRRRETSLWRCPWPRRCPLAPTCGKLPRSSREKLAATWRARRRPGHWGRGAVWLAFWRSQLVQLFPAPSLSGHRETSP